MYFPKGAETCYAICFSWNHLIHRIDIMELATGGRVNFAEAGRALTEKSIKKILKKDNLINFQGDTKELSNLTNQYIENYAQGSKRIAANQLGYYTDNKNNSFIDALKRKRNRYSRNTRIR
jgi:hypothetical protein